jgi:hypothetical protein
MLDATEPELERLILDKHEWIKRGQWDGDRKRRHDAIVELNRQLSARLRTREAALRELRRQLTVDLHRAKILRSREYSFVLFPESLMSDLSGLAQSG